MLVSVLALLSVFAMHAAAHPRSRHARRSIAPIVAHYQQQQYPLDETLATQPGFKQVDLSYFFAAPTNSYAFDEPDAGAIYNFVRIAHKNNVKAVLTIGGWKGSHYFSALVSNDYSRGVFATAIANYLTTTGLDGCDLDWEYVASPGIGDNIFDPQDANNLLTFLATLRAAIGPTKIITLCTAMAPYQIDGQTLALAPFAAVVNYLNVMTYEVSGVFSAQTGPLAPLTSCRSPTSVEVSVAAYIAAGFPAAQLLIGIPAYATSFTTASSWLATMQGLDWNGQPTASTTQFYQDKVFANGVCSTAQSAAVCNYSDLIAKGILTADGARAGEGWIRTVDACTGGSPYVFNPTTNEMITYDDAASIAIKASYVKNNGVGGIFLFDARGFTPDIYSAIRSAYTPRPILVLPSVVSSAATVHSSTLIASASAAASSSLAAAVPAPTVLAQTLAQALNKTSVFIKPSSSAARHRRHASSSSFAPTFLSSLLLSLVSLSFLLDL